MVMVWVGVPGSRAFAGVCSFIPCPIHSKVRDVPGTTSSVVSATMSTPRMGTEEEGKGRER